MTDLDDFFAKKDKKRGKNKPKGAALSAEALVRELGEGSKTADYHVRKDNKNSAALEILGLDSNDADWKDFEEVERRDYTGLKVKEMSLQDQTDEEQRRLEQAEVAPEQTPWKIKEETSAAISADNSATAATVAAATATATAAAAAAAAAAATKQNKLLQVDAEGAASASGNTKSSDTDKSVSSTDQLAASTSEQPAAKAKGESEAAPASGQTAAVPETKEGDSKPNPSAKKEAYKPPAERNAEVRQLEPIRGSSLKSSWRTKGGSQHIDLSDVTSFPSLG